MSTLHFIGLTEVPRDNDPNPRGSCLSVSSEKSDAFTVIGNLPHGYSFRPKTLAERDAFVTALQAIGYPEYQCTACYRDEQTCSNDPCMTVEQERNE